MSTPDSGRPPAATPEQIRALRAALRRRLDLIADHAFRDRDPVAHLAALRSASEVIDQLKPHFAGDPRLNHFLEGASYSKALAWIGED